MTFVAFTKVMDRLAGLKFAPKNAQTHWEALCDLGDAELIAAIGRAQKECEEFPSPRMIRMFVDEYRGRVYVPEESDRSSPWTGEPEIVLPNGARLPVTPEWRYYCEECSDIGMRSFWCGSSPSTRYPWLRVQRCGRRQAHGDHEWAEVCPCATHNPDVLRKKARAQQVTRKQANA